MTWVYWCDNGSPHEEHYYTTEGNLDAWCPGVDTDRSFSYSGESQGKESHAERS